MTIYRDALGKDFGRLHIKLQKRYALSPGTEFKASGLMKEIKGGPKWLSPFFTWTAKRKFLFPESGRDIPFTIGNRSYFDSDGSILIYWERIFVIQNKKRYFNALMRLNPTRKVIEDYLGEPALFYSDLICSVTDDGGMNIKSGKQHLMIGKVSLPLPRLFQGIVSVTEGYDDSKDRFLIRVSIRNPLLGQLFYYEGEFTEDEK